MTPLARQPFPLLFAMAVACLLAGCRAAPEPTHAAERTPAEPAAAPRRVRLDAAQLAQIRIEALTTRPIADTISATGTVEFNADRMSRILAPVAGQVQQLRVNVGDVVRQGDVLFEISSRDVAAVIGEHLASHKDLELSEKTYAMTKDLFEHQAASRIALEQAESDLAKNRAKVRQTEEAMRVLGVDVAASERAEPMPSRIPVRAPIGGTVIDRTVTSGQYVGNDAAPLMTLADVSSVWVSADVFERDLHHISPGQRADVTTAAYPDERFSAHVSRVGAVVDPQTRTSKVRFVVVNPDGHLKPGMFITAMLYLPASADVLTMPAKALFVEDGRSYAYVQTGANQFARRAVETAPAGTERVRVTQGLAAGDRVVCDGVLLLRQLDADSGSE
jgi:cobalt-zinc-cadmium efflux system membrane fusion protein